MSDSALLERIQDSVNDWLKFAELKNGALATFDMTVGLALSAWLVGESSGVPGAAVPLIASLVCGVTVGALCLLYSFAPRLTPPNGLLPIVGRVSPDDSPLYFADIAKYNAEGFLVLMAARLARDAQPWSAYHLRVAEQIVVNARICLAKYQLFTAALAALGLGIIVGGALTVWRSLSFP